MAVFEFFGLLGGCLVVFDFLIKLCKLVLEKVNEYNKYKDAYLDREENDNKRQTAGFKTELEKLKEMAEQEKTSNRKSLYSTR